MLTGSFSLATVRLCLVCLLVLTPQTAAKLCARALHRRVTGMIKTARLNPPDSRLYTPPILTNQTCLSSTLQCFSEEIQVLLDEWATAGVKTFNGSNFKSNIKTLAKSLNLTSSECFRCELLVEKGAVEFLEDLLKTFQMINSHYNCLL